jgi:tetratricopeptide (TPR) repeat protein
MFIIVDGFQIDKDQQKDLLKACRDQMDPAPETLLEAFRQVGLGIPSLPGPIDICWFEEPQEDWQKTLEPFLTLIAPFTRQLSRLTVLGDGEQAHEFTFFMGEVNKKRWKPGAAGWFRYHTQINDKQAQDYCLQQSLAHDPEYIPALHYRASLQLAMRKPKEALPLATSALALTNELYRERSQLAALLGRINLRCYRSQGEHTYLEAANHAFEQAIEWQPELLEAMYGQACTSSILGQLDRSLSLLKRVLQQDPDYKRKAEQEPDLEALRATPAFQAVVRHSAPPFASIFSGQRSSHPTRLGQATFECQELGQLSLSGELIVADLALTETPIPLTWGRSGRFVVMAAIAHSYEQPVPPEMACLLVLPSKGGARSPKDISHWELVEQDNGDPWHVHVDNGTLAFMTPSNYKRLHTSPKRHHTLCDTVVAAEEDGTFELSGGKVIVARFTPGPIRSWWGINSSGERACLALAFDVLP